MVAVACDEAGASVAVAFTVIVAAPLSVMLPVPGVIATGVPPLNGGRTSLSVTPVIWQIAARTKSPSRSRRLVMPWSDGVATTGVFLVDLRSFLPFLSPRAIGEILAHKEAVTEGRRP
jgi:hypothetical protein